MRLATPFMSLRRRISINTLFAKFHHSPRNCKDIACAKWEKDRIILCEGCKHPRKWIIVCARTPPVLSFASLPLLAFSSSCTGTVYVRSVAFIASWKANEKSGRERPERKREIEKIRLAAIFGRKDGAIFEPLSIGCHDGQLVESPRCWNMNFRKYVRAEVSILPWLVTLVYGTVARICIFKSSVR